MKVKRRIYIQNYCILLIFYLVLMIAFSGYELSRQRIMRNLQCDYYAQDINNTADNVLEDNLDSNKQIMDKDKLTKELLLKLYYIQSSMIEVAIYDGDYNLLYSANDDWICIYMDQEKQEGNTYNASYGYLDPEEWLEEAEIAELENYLKVQPIPKKVGDLATYSVRLDNFWVDGSRIIPQTITVMPMYASGFDDKGNLISSSSTGGNITYSVDTKASYDLPFYEYGTVIINQGKYDQDNELHRMVIDGSKLHEATSQTELRRFERINLWSYRYYYAIPYQNMLSVNEVDGESFYSDFWTVVVFQVDLWGNISKTMICIWVGCLALFVAAATLLSRIMYKNYRIHAVVEHENEALDELTDAMNSENTKHERHVLKTIQETIKHDPEVVPLHYEEVSLGELCQKVMDQFETSCKYSYITADLKGDAVVKADALQLEKVMDLFFRNALDYTHYCGKIHIDIDDKRLEFSISGKAIPEESLTKIWRVNKDANATQSEQRTGLGLLTAARILEQHQFTFGATNREDGIVLWFAFDHTN